jgi:hypothetical protein
MAMTFNLKAPIVVFLLSFFCYFFVWLGLFLVNKNKILIQSEDAIPATYVPLSLLKGNGFVLTEYYDYFIKNWPNPENRLGKPYYLFRFKKWEFVSAFTVITPILAMPFYLPISVLNVDYVSPLIPITARFASSFFVSLSVLFVYLSLAKIIKNIRISILATISYAFGSICWGTTSQSLWQHGINQFLLSCGFYLLFIKKPLSFLLFSLAVFSRPTNVVFALWAFVYILLKGRKDIFKYLLWSIPPLIFQLWYDDTYLGGVFNHPYSPQQFSNWQGRFPEGFFGLLLSPSKGLLILSPVFIFSIVGIVTIWKIKDFSEYKVLSIILALFFLVMGKWIHWYGGWSFGYRMVSEALPFLAIFLGFGLDAVLKRPLLNKMFFTLLAFSIFVQFLGLVFDFRHWHALFDDGPYQTGWLWSVVNSMPLYFIKLALSKFGILL